MNNQFSFPDLISLFQSVEEHLHHHNLEVALSRVRTILAYDRNNYYALAIERRLMRLLDFQQTPSDISYSTKYYSAIVIVALENVCQMAVRFQMNLQAEASS
ncbi:MAG: hypothetical protein EHM64_02120 [Ignavibacteriae bacterium]|nr:MAG: hypothetical protein EHM64_02120 [Ignavibacteriota bacterium]